MATNRAPRTTETRENKSRRKPWAPPNRLAAPPAPDGYVHRWIRVQMRGEDDKTNAFSRLREGWEPVRAEELTEFGDMYPVISEGQYAGVIGNGGLILCRIPEETVAERSEYYGNRTREQMTAVDQDLMRENNPQMPIHADRKSRVTFGGRGSGSE